MDKKYPNLYQRARLSTGMSQERAAELLGLSPESLKQYEGGKTVPKDETVARMVEVYRLPWLAYEHSQATDRLQDATGRLDALLRIAEDGVIDEAERPEFDSIVVELRETMAAIYQVIYSGAKKERPDGGSSRRSVQGLRREQSQDDYSTLPARLSSPSFSRRGGVSL